MTVAPEPRTAEAGLCCGGDVVRDGRVAAVTHRQHCEFYLRRCCDTVAEAGVEHATGCANDPFATSA